MGRLKFDFAARPGKEVFGSMFIANSLPRPRTLHMQNSDQAKTAHPSLSCKVAFVEKLDKYEQGRNFYGIVVEVKL